MPILDDQEYFTYINEVEKQQYFVKERDFLAKKYGVKPSSIEFNEFHPCSEVCIFIGGKWYGYVDEELEDEMNGVNIDYWQQ